MQTFSNRLGRMRRLLLLLSLSLAAGWAFPSFLAAASVLLPQTGQTICWGVDGLEIACPSTGQDGELQKGEAWPIPRFSADGEGKLTDNLTGLVWSRDANLLKTRNPAFDLDGAPGDGAVSWGNALAYLRKLNNESYLGHSDWRLPNIRELRSLVHYGTSRPNGWLGEAAQGFVNVQLEEYWSSTTSAISGTTGAKNMAWSVRFLDGSQRVKAKAEAHWVWPVRGGGEKAVKLPTTGQQTCWNVDGAEIGCKFPERTWQDGDLRTGEAWPSPRFTASGQTVVDDLTGLIWARDADNPGPAACSPGTAKTWQQVLDHLRCLNENRYLGYGDWRLPTIHELESLVSYEVNFKENSDQTLSVAEWLQSAGIGFAAVRQSPYWSSTTVAASPACAWGVNMYAGYLEAVDKSGAFHLWPVRDGVYLIGDINGDLRVDMTDALISLQILVRTRNYPVRDSYVSSGADVSGNAKVGLEEILYILQEAAELR